ncbi:MAG: response regulator [Cyclobacteriaceae bacterium]
MEELNGIDTLREIRKRGWKTPVIVLTHYDEQALVLHLQELGISGFLQKKF